MAAVTMGTSSLTSPKYTKYHDVCTGTRSPEPGLWDLEQEDRSAGNDQCHTEELRGG